MSTENYQSLADPHLNEYFNNKRIRRHLIKAGLINRHGDILPPKTYEVVLAQRTKIKQAKQLLSRTITNYVIEEERKRQKIIRDQFDFAMKRSRVQKLKESKHQPHRSMSHSLVNITKHSKTRNARTPSPVSHKRSPVRAKSAHHPPIVVKNQLVRRPTTAKQSSNDDHCTVTMIYYGPQISLDTKNNWHHPHGDEIVVMQQHCGGENLIVFKGYVKPNEIFTFESHRHPDYPFALALYINGLIDSRISVCCEYKHKYNKRLGSKTGLFGIYDVQNSKPCRSCQFAKRKKKTLLNVSIKNDTSPYQRSIVRRIPFTTEFRPEILLRTPSPLSEKEKETPKEKINRISTICQASSSPRRLSSPSSLNKDKINELDLDESKNTHLTVTFDDKLPIPDQQSIDKKDDDEEKPSRVSSSNSKKSYSSSTSTSFKKEEPHHLSEPILIRRNSDDENFSSNSSSTISVKNKDVSSKNSKSPDSLPIPIFNDDDDRNSLKSSSSRSLRDEDNHHSTKILAERYTNDHFLSSSSSNETLRQSSSSLLDFFSTKKDDDDDTSKILTKKIDDNKQTSRSSSKISNSSFKNKPKEINDHHSLISSPSTASIDRPLLTNNQYERQRHLSTSSYESNHDSIKNQPEYHHLSLSSIDNQQTNYINAQNLLKTDINSSDDDDDNIKLKSKFEQKIQNEDDDV